jgi:hypothetical protein
MKEIYRREGQSRRLTLVSRPAFTRFTATIYRVFDYDPSFWPYAPAGVSASASDAAVPAERFRDEIIERNLIIAELHAKLSRFDPPRRSQLRIFLSQLKRRLFSAGEQAGARRT